MLASLRKFGTPAIPMHMAIYNLPLTLAVRLNIPLVVYGENSSFEYGGTESGTQGFQVTREWISKYGVTHGTIAEDWVSDSISIEDLTAYQGPTDEQLENNDVRAIFLGHYFKWDVENSLNCALKYGFRVREEGPKTGYYNYADIDCDFISIHHWLKWYKFGFTRLWDNLSIEIKNERMSREEAIAIIKERGDEFPAEDVERFCTYVGISIEEFMEICEKFRNHDIWTSKDGKWEIEDFLIPDWEW